MSCVSRMITLLLGPVAGIPPVVGIGIMDFMLVKFTDRARGISASALPSALKPARSDCNFWLKLSR